MFLSFEQWNFIIAVLALLVAIYSVYYTRKCNRRKLTVTADVIYTQASGPAIFWFSVNNLSPLPVVVDSIEFFLPSGKSVSPVNFEPEQTYSIGAFDSRIASIIPDYLYADHINSGDILYPHSSESLGYYFNEPYASLVIKINCLQRIHHFKKHQSFLVHFSDVQQCTDIDD